MEESLRNGSIERQNPGGNDGLSSQEYDPYQLRPEAIENPPRRLSQALRRIGPGLILAGVTVGSGELIATTVLGAKAGYTVLWLILVSCLVKVAVQGELGRYTIGTGETTLEAFNRVPGPRFRVSWVVWLWLLSTLGILVSVGGMMGAISEVLHMMVPSISVPTWVWLVNAVTVALLLIGRYAAVERISIALVACLTALTMTAALVLLKKPEYFSWSQVADGLTFKLPEGGFATAVAVFGATGLGANELVMYSYWCIEKGYARFTGPRDDSEAWRKRAHGWIRVMGVDVLTSMVVYTFATIAFYFLGAGILHGMDLVPEGNEAITALSQMYTETLGDWSRTLFLVGAVAVLYSTVFAGAAANSRVLADFIGMTGLYDRSHYGTRLKVTRVLVVLVLFVPALNYMLLEAPVRMVIIGGISQALLLPIVGFSTIYLRHRQLPSSIRPGNWITLALWITSTIMALMMGYSLFQLVYPLLQQIF